MAITNIVVGVDGSAGANAALRWVADVARQTGARVFPVHVLEIPDDDRGPGMFHDGWRQTIRTQFENMWCRPLRRAQIDYTPLLAEGPAASSIIGVAREKNADLLVVGRRGRSGVAQLVLGSVSHDVVQTSAVPVLVIGPEASRKARQRHRSREKDT